MCTSKSHMQIRASDIFGDVLVSDEEDNCHKEETSTESQYFSGGDEVGDVLDDLYINNGNSASDIHTNNDSGLDGHQDFSNNDDSGIDKHHNFSNNDAGDNSGIDELEHQDFSSNNDELVRGFNIESGKPQGILGHAVLISEISRR